ncbi:MAG: hypothetical protein JJT77_04445, partial [Crocinitomicaceae bacterium]|nr:hypothetical protein [Crocinitomicaceae bacterium]
MKKLLFFLVVILLNFTTNAQTIITQWNFNDETLNPNIGAGLAANIGGTSSAFAAGAAGNPERGWNTSAYPNQFSGLGGQGGGAGVEFAISTVGFENIQLDLDHRASGTASRWANIQYTTDGGATWTNFANNAGGLSPDNTFHAFSFDFSACAACNDNADFAVRILSIFSPDPFDQNENDTFGANEAYQRANTQSGPVGTGQGTGDYSPSGTWRFDNVTFSGDVIATAQEFWAISGTDLHLLSAWSDDPSGTGAQPLSFSDAAQTFYIHTSTATIGDNWEVSGAGSKVILGNGTDAATFVVPQNFSFTGEIDINDAATLELNNSTIPTFGSIAADATVIFKTDATNLPYHSYGNLILDDIQPVFNGNGVVNIQGNVTLLNSVQMPNARGAAEYNLLFNGAGNQMITTNGNALRSYNFEVNKSSGELTLATNSIVSSDNQLIVFFDQTATFADNGATIYAGNSVNIGGNGTAYDFSGTVVLADEIANVVLGAGNGNNFNLRATPNSNTNIAAALNNLTIQAVNQGGEFRLRSGSTDSLYIKGNLIIESAVEGRVRWYNNKVYVGGDITIEAGFDGLIDNVNDLHIVGIAPQTYSADFTDYSVENLHINNEITVSGDWHVSNVLALNQGMVNTSSSASIYLAAGGQILGGNANSFVNGPFFAAVADNVPTTINFPIGAAGAYRPIALLVDQTAANSVWYVGEVVDAPAPTLPLTGDLEQVSSVRYFTVDQVTAEPVDALTITLTYGADENITSIGNVRVAHNQNSEWSDLGGIGTATPAGEVTSTLAFTSFGDFTIGSIDPLVVQNPEIIVTPSTLNFFNQELGSPSPSQTISVSGIFLDDDITVTAPAGFELATDAAGPFNTTITLNANNGEVPATIVYIHLNQTALGTAAGDIILESPNATTQEITVEGETTATPTALDLIYYWHFNNMDLAAPDVVTIDADYSLIPNFIPTMTYIGTGNRDMDAYENGSSLNLQMGEVAGLAARVRNRSEDRALIFNLSTAGVEDVVFEYAVYRSGQGMLFNIIEYSIDGGSTFTQAGLSQTSFAIQEVYELITIDFSGIAATNNNPDFQIRITWEGNTEGTSGNNRYDNITLMGKNIDVATTEENLANASFVLYPNPAQNYISLDVSVPFHQIIIQDLTGK